jgi:acyl-CoA thioester hydrolase
MARMPRHRVMTPLRWSDMDAYGHINNVQFLQLLEEARVVAFSDGITVGEDLPSTGLLVARSEIEYLEPLLYRPAPIAIDLWVTRIGAADFDMAYEVLDHTETGTGTGTGAGAGAGRVYARAETNLVAFDLRSARPRRITPDERERLEGWRDGPVRWRRRRPGAR